MLYCVALSYQLSQVNLMESVFSKGHYVKGQSLFISSRFPYRQCLVKSGRLTITLTAWFVNH